MANFAHTRASQSQLKAQSKGRWSQVRLASLLVALVGSSFAFTAVAEGPTPAERAQGAADTRQGAYKLIVHYFGPIVGMARGQIPFDADTVAANASKIQQLAQMTPDLFKNDTREFDIDTEALPKIWDNLDDFNAKAATLAERAGALAAAAPKGKGPAMKAFGAVGGACKGCHDEYRQQD